MTARTDDVAALLDRGDEISARFRLARREYEAAARRRRWASGRRRHATDPQARAKLSALLELRTSESDRAFAAMEAVLEEQRANSRAIRSALIG